MPIYFGLYKVNPDVQPPKDPRERLKQLEDYKAALQNDLKSGIIKESHEFLEGHSGYFITKDISAEQAHAGLAGWFPRVIVELHQTIPSETAIENAINAAKKESAGIK